MAFSIEDLWALNNKAQENFLYVGEEKKYLEAFLIQSCLLEGALKEFAISSIQKKISKPEEIVKKKKENYNFDTAIDDLYILGFINNREFTNLHKYRQDRNRYIHRLIKEDFKDLNKVLKNAYRRGSPFVNNILNKLEKL